MTSRQSVEAAVAAVAALKEHLSADDCELVRHALRAHRERVWALIATRGGEELEPAEFARFMLEIAKRVEREGSCAS